MTFFFFLLKSTVGPLSWIFHFSYCAFQFQNLLLALFHTLYFFILIFYGDKLSSYFPFIFRHLKNFFVHILKYLI